MNTHVSRAAPNHIRPEPVGRMAHGPPERDPRRTHNRDLPAHGVHRGVLDAAEAPRAEARAHDERVDGRRVRAAAEEEAGAALGDLRDVLDGAAHERAAGRHEAPEEVGEVGGRVDVDRREGRAALRAGDEVGLRQLLELRERGQAGNRGGGGRERARRASSLDTRRGRRGGSRFAARA